MGKAKTAFAPVALTVFMRRRLPEAPEWSAEVSRSTAPTTLDLLFKSGRRAPLNTFTATIIAICLVLSLAASFGTALMVLAIGFTIVVAVFIGLNIPARIGPRHHQDSDAPALSQTHQTADRAQDLITN